MRTLPQQQQEKGGFYSWEPQTTLNFPPSAEIYMLWTIFVILIVLWLLGFIGHVAGGFIHLLLVIAVIVLVIRLVQGRAP
ncbi:MAG TPA: lmo0937 family membrane protein [Chthoniobacterales bacterium]|nr:lmo0937 family membrane protein [Chthoniobacterales bacterium]